MKDKMEEVFSLQKSFEEMMNLDRYPKDVEGKVSALCTAMIHEAVELQRTTNWKWWKKPVSFNQADAREELVDIWHFLIQASIELGLTPDDILKEYQRKNEIKRWILIIFYYQVLLASFLNLTFLLWGVLVDKVCEKMPIPYLVIFFWFYNMVFCE